jgi:hypothetical protein
MLVLGGFLTSPPIYERFRDRLLRLGAGAVVVAPIWTPDWLLAAPRGLGSIVTRAGRALLRAGEVSAVASGGAPILVVGHSAGGMIGRLLTSPEPFEGRRLAAAERIGAIVSLGTPHRVLGGPDDAITGQALGRRAVWFAERVVPGAAFAPRVGYLSIGSRRVIGRRDAVGPAGIAWRSYRGLLGSECASDGEPGDGVVPLACALLPGSRQVVFDDIGHGIFGRLPWYGSDGVVDRWWPEALDAWRSALAARIETVEGASPARSSERGG